MKDKRVITSSVSETTQQNFAAKRLYSGVSPPLKAIRAETNCGPELAGKRYTDVSLPIILKGGDRWTRALTLERLKN